MQGQVERATAVAPWVASGWTLLRWFSMLLLGMAVLLGLGWPRAHAMGQAQPAQAQTAPARTAVVPNPQPAARPATAAENEHTAGGPHEGIQVHGHWVIEVKNPDGTVTARREFENSIQPNGAVFLASLIAGNNASGSIAVLLNGASTYFLSYGAVTFGESGPCLPLGDVSTPSAYSTGTTCVIAAPPNAQGAAGFFSQLCAFAIANSEPYCSTNLAVGAPTETQSNFGTTQQGQIQLTGSVTVSAASGGNVTDVETVFSACGAGSTVSNCAYQVLSNGANPPGTYLVAIGLFTGRALDGLNGDPAPVSYSPGQAINVSVTISFQ